MANMVTQWTINQRIRIKNLQNLHQESIDQWQENKNHEEGIESYTQTTHSRMLVAAPSMSTAASSPCQHIITTWISSLISL